MVENEVKTTSGGEFDLLLSNAEVLDEESRTYSGYDIGITQGRIAYMGAAGLHNRPAKRILDCSRKLVIPALYNTHTHLPMAILKGYADDLPLQEWLTERIFPAEDKLTGEAVYWASLLAIAEQIRNGVVFSSDMYSLCDHIVRAVDESGFKCNVARGVVSFDPDEDCRASTRYREAVELHRSYHNAADGRIKIDMSIHAEYTSHPAMVRAVADYAHENGLGMHLHLSETLREHQEGIERRGMTPAAYFDSLGAFDGRTVAAHCVHLSDEDIALLAERGVYVAHCPVSNMKLASGFARAPLMRDAGVRLTFGTDGSASNNSLDILKEMQAAVLTQKALTGSPTVFPAAGMLAHATALAADAQGREDCGRLKVGMKADIVALDLDDVTAIPMYDYSSALMYSMSARNVALTICDGKVLYENGVYTTIDVEKVGYNVGQIVKDVYKT